MSKRILVFCLVLGMLAGALAVPAQAKKKKKKAAPPAPIATVLYLEGENSLGEQDGGVPVAAPGTYLQLVKEPGSGEKSMGIPSYMAGPNNNCGGNSLFPNFLGELSGTITGDVKVSFEAIGSPGSSVEVRIWPDLFAQACNESYIEPAGKVTVTLPSARGLVEAVIPGVNFDAVSGILIQLTGVAGSTAAPSVPPFYGRAYYGLETTKVEFLCMPASGAASCI